MPVLSGGAVKFRPLHDRIVIKRIEAEAKSAGGIIIPDTVKEKPQQGTILAVGPGRVLDSGTKIPVDYKVGDSVLYSKYSGSEVKIDGKDYIVISEKDVLGVFTDAKVPVGV